MMTSIKHDESIESLSGNKMAENGHKKLPAPSNADEGKEMLPKTESESEKQQQLDHKRRIARIKKLVFIISAVLILMAVVLVGVTLFMAGHIDDEVLKSKEEVQVTAHPGPQVAVEPEDVTSPG